MNYYKGFVKFCLERQPAENPFPRSNGKLKILYKFFYECIRNDRFPDDEDFDRVRKEINSKDDLETFKNQVSAELLSFYLERFCKYCKIISSKKIPKCADCQYARYCNMECLRKDWPEHKEFCRKNRKCANCKKTYEKTYLCSGCRRAWYCGVECQNEHWQNDHKYECE